MGPMRGQGTRMTLLKEEETPGFWGGVMLKESLYVSTSQTSSRRCGVAPMERVQNGNRELITEVQESPETCSYGLSGHRSPLTPGREAREEEIASPASGVGMSVLR